MMNWDFMDVGELLRIKRDYRIQDDRFFLARALWLIAERGHEGVDVDWICDNFGYPSGHGEEFDRYLEVMADLCVHNLTSAAFVIKDDDGYMTLNETKIKALGSDSKRIAESPDRALEEIGKMVGCYELRLMKKATRR